MSFEPTTPACRYPSRWAIKRGQCGLAHPQLKLGCPQSGHPMFGIGVQSNREPRMRNGDSLMGSGGRGAG